MVPQPNFSDVPLFIGIDVHKKQWSVSIYSQHTHHRTFSQPPSSQALKSYLDHHFPHAPVSCAYEASKFGFWIQRQLQGFGYRCLVVNPADIPTSHKEASEKTDPSDSRKIARALRAGLLSSIHIPSTYTEGQRMLFRYRKKLLADLNRVKNRIKDKFVFCGIPIPAQYDNPNWSKDFLRWLAQAELSGPLARLTVDRLLEQYRFLHRHLLRTSVEVRALQRSGHQRHLAKLLRTIPGIGPLTTVELLAEIEDIARFPSFKKFNSYIGLKPSTHASGERDHKGRLSVRQRKGLRSSLIECAWTSIAKDPVMMQRYNQLKERLTAKRAIVIIARKLASRIYYVLKNQKPYEIGTQR